MKTLKARSWWGKFNLLDPSQESCSIDIRFEDTENGTIDAINLNFKQSPYDLNGFIEVEDALYFIQEWQKKTLYATDQDEVAKFAETIKLFETEIEMGNIEKQIETLTAIRYGCDEDIERLQNKLQELNKNQRSSHE